MVPLTLYRLLLRHYSCFLSISPDIILSLPVPAPPSSPVSPLLVPGFLLVLYIPAIMFHSFLSIHLHVALLIPSHLLHSALIPPVSPPAPSKSFPRARPTSTHSFSPDSFPLGYPFHSSLYTYLCHVASPFLFTLLLCHTFPTILPLTFQWSFLSVL